MNLAEAIQSVDIGEIINSMNAYAISQLKSVGEKDFNGKLPVDFVGDVILKVMEGTRDWNNAECSFKEFLFGCLKSEISNFFKTKRVYHSSSAPLIAVNDNYGTVEQDRKQVAEFFKLEGADDDELTVLECWMDGMNKPSEIAEDLGIDVKEVYKIVKRLDRKRERVFTHTKNIV